MLKRLWLSSLLSMLCGVVLVTAPAEAAIDSTEVVACPDTNTVCWPSAFDFNPKGNIYYAQRYTGEIRIYKPDSNANELWKTIGNIGTDGEQGVLGLALDPRWPEKPWVYVYFTQADPLKNKVIRLKKKEDGTFKRETLISFPANSNHNGGVIKFGPDGKLYILVGDVGDSANAQELGVKPGKVYRLNKNGTTPTDNPFDGSAQFFSWGHRNMYGLAFDPFDPNPETVEAWVTENGPECNDELNYVEKSNQYGWGYEQACPDTNNSGDAVVEPVFTWEDVIAVTGAEFCNDCKLGSPSTGDLFIGSYNDGDILRANLNNDRDGVSTVEAVYEHGNGILGMQANAAGKIFFSDSTGIHRLIKN